MVSRDCGDEVKMMSMFEKDKPSKVSVRIMLLLTLFLIIATIFIWNNYDWYQTPIAKVTKVEETLLRTEYGVEDTKENYYEQAVTGKLMNGEKEGAEITLTHIRSSSGILDDTLKTGDDIFISYDQEIKEWQFNDLKRDHYVMLVLVVFIIAVALIGRYRGMLSLLSVVVNILIFSLVINQYLNGRNILIPTILAVLFFSVFSLLFYCGFKLLTLVAILATLGGLLGSMLIMIGVIALTNYDGVWVESLEFLIIETDFKSIFFAGLMIGGLGGIMDIAITITSSLFELKEENPTMTSKELMESGRIIGKDIMGTMVNVMFFAFVGGSLPIILLSMKNGINLGNYLTNFATLELVRFLAGSIGLVLTIPISLFIVIFVLEKRRKAL